MFVHVAQVLVGPRVNNQKHIIIHIFLIRRLRISTGKQLLARGRPAGVFTSIAEEINSDPPSDNSNQWLKWDLNLGPPDFKSGTRPSCLLGNYGVFFALYVGIIQMYYTHAFIYSCSSYVTRYLVPTRSIKRPVGYLQTWLFTNVAGSAMKLLKLTILSKGIVNPRLSV